MKGWNVNGFGSYRDSKPIQNDGTMSTNGNGYDTNGGNTEVGLV